MSTTINSFAELFNITNAKLELVVRDTIQDLLKELQNIIIREVYSYPISGENWDNRTYEFLESWNASEPMLVGNLVQAVISQDGFNFTWVSDRGMWSHGNGLNSIFTEFLDDIINDGLDESNFNFPAIDARPYWSMFKIFVAENVNLLFIKNCQKHGLPLMNKISYKFT